MLHNPDRRIFKYPLELTDHQTITIRSFTPCMDVLHVDMQNDTITLWAENDVTGPEVEIDVFIVGTGNPMPNGAILHIGTVVDAHGFVWHVFTTHVHTDDDDEHDDGH